MNTDDTNLPDTPAPGAHGAHGDSRRVLLDTPLRRANGIDITEVQVLKPLGGALRGLNLTELLQMNTSALHAILPRITQPQITKPDLAQLDPADLVALGTAVIGFLVPKNQRADFQSE